MFFPAIILTVLSVLLMKFSTADNKLLETLSMVVVVVNIILLTYAEAWFYVGKLLVLPFRKLGTIIGFLVFIFTLHLALWLSYVHQSFHCFMKNTFAE